MARHHIRVAGVSFFLLFLITIHGAHSTATTVGHASALRMFSESMDTLNSFSHFSNNNNDVDDNFNSDLLVQIQNNHYDSKSNDSKLRAISEKLDAAFDMLLMTDPSDLGLGRDGDVLIGEGENDEGITDWFKEKYNAVKSFRDLPSVIGEANALSGEGSDDGSGYSISATEVVSAVLYGLFDGLTMGMGEMYRDAIEDYKNDETCQNGSDAVDATFKSAKSVVTGFFAGIFGSSELRGGKGRVDFVGHQFRKALLSLGALFESIVNLVKTCEPLKTMLLPIAMLVVLGVVMTLVLFLVPGFGIVLKVAGALLSIIFGFKFIVQTAGKISGAVSRCVAAGSCDSHGKISLIEGFAQLAGVMVALIFLSGINEALKTPNLAQQFSKAAMMLRVRLAFTPRWSKDIHKLTKMLDLAKAGNSGAARAQLRMISKESSLADDATKMSSTTASSRTGGTAAGTTGQGAAGKGLVDDIVSPHGGTKHGRVGTVQPNSAANGVSQSALRTGLAKLAEMKRRLVKTFHEYVNLKRQSTNWKNLNAKNAGAKNPYADKLKGVESSGMEQMRAAKEHARSVLAKEAAVADKATKLKGSIHNLGDDIKNLEQVTDDIIAGSNRAKKASSSSSSSSSSSCRINMVLLQVNAHAASSCDMFGDMYADVEGVVDEAAAVMDDVNRQAGRITRSRGSFADDVDAIMSEAQAVQNEAYAIQREAMHVS